jgi:hypothetical protein
MVTTSTNRHHNSARPSGTPAKLAWAVASAMVIAVAAIVIAVVALASRPAPAAPASLPSYHYTGTVDGRCMPSDVVHPC